MNKGLFLMPLIILTGTALIWAGSPAEKKTFGPQGMEVLTGDAALKHKTRHRNHSDRSRLRLNVSNGFQGGAYFLIKFFQEAISPQDGPNCRHNPTCSAYGRDAVVKHGAFWGAVMAGDRLLRCNPYYPPGNDPVPDNPPFRD